MQGQQLWLFVNYLGTTQLPLAYVSFYLTIKFHDEKI